MRNLLFILLAIFALSCTSYRKDWDSGAKAKGSHMQEQKQEQQEELQIQYRGYYF